MSSLLKKGRVNLGAFKVGRGEFQLNFRFLIKIRIISIITKNFGIAEFITHGIFSFDFSISSSANSLPKSLWPSSALFAINSLNPKILGILASFS